MKWINKNSILFIILIISYISCSEISVNYNEELDFNTKNSTIYFPSNSISKKSINKKKNLLENQKSKNLINTPKIFQETESEEPICEEEMVTGGTYWFYLFMVTCLTLFAGMMSGLTVGYLSVDQLTMELRQTTGTPQEKEYSKIILPVLSNRHWLLCTLLLMNSFAMEALPVFLDRIFSRFAAVVISVTLLLIFGEVIPQALCTGPRQIQIAAYAAPMTRLLMLVSWPITFWLGKVLDIILGEQGKTRYQNQDLKALVEMHTEESLRKIAEEEEKNPYIAKDDIPKPSNTMGLSKMEAGFMISALTVRDKKVGDITIPFHKVYSISFEEKINKEKVQQIMARGFSRIPVYRGNDPTDIIGILRIKKLINIDVDKNKSLKELGIRLSFPLVIKPTMTLIDLLKEFEKGKSHMAFITPDDELLQAKLGLNRNNSVAFPNRFMEIASEQPIIRISGIVTLEDVIEQIFKLNILDEEDYEKKKLKDGKDRMADRLSRGSKFNMYFTSTVKETFIKDETEKINNLIKEGLKNNSDIKDKFLNKMNGNNLEEKLIHG